MSPIRRLPGNAHTVVGLEQDINREMTVSTSARQAYAGRSCSPATYSGMCSSSRMTTRMQADLEYN